MRTNWEIRGMSVEIRTEPRVSVNKLGEYMTATARRRKGIIETQKSPADFIVPRYDPATSAIAQSIVEQSPSAILEAFDRLDRELPKTKWTDQRNSDCQEALEKFRTIRPELQRRLGSSSLTLGTNTAPKLSVSGVDISVRPEILVRNEDRDGTPLFGAVKLYLSKTYELDENSAQYVGTVLHQYIEQFVVDDDGQADHRACCVVDVFAQKIYDAPRAFRARRKDIEAACEEIALRWSVS